MISPNARKTTFIFIGIIMATVFFDLFIADRSFSYDSGGNKNNTDTIMANVSKVSWFWKQ